MRAFADCDCDDNPDDELVPPLIADQLKKLNFTLLSHRLIHLIHLLTSVGGGEGGREGGGDNPTDNGKTPTCSVSSSKPDSWHKFRTFLPERPYQLN